MPGVPDPRPKHAERVMLASAVPPSLPREMAQVPSVVRAPYFASACSAGRVAVPGPPSPGRRKRPITLLEAASGGSCCFKSSWSGGAYKRATATKH